MTAMPGVIRRTKPRVKTDCQQASSHSEEQGMKEGGVKKKKNREMPLGLTESQFGCSILHYQGQTKQLERKCCN